MTSEISRIVLPVVLVAALVAAGCTRTGTDERGNVADTTDFSASTVADTAVIAWFPEQFSAADLDRARLDTGWRRFVQIDSTAPAGAPGGFRERWDRMTPREVNTAPMSLPLYGDIGGPSVLRVQILLDRARFSPGMIDGRWGRNTEIAVYWLQRREGLPATGRLDSTTFRRLVDLAGNPDSLVVAYPLTPADVEGPFEKTPADVYEQARVDRLVYQSLSEKLSEQFHISPDLLKQLNPGARLDSLKAGDRVYVPVLAGAPAPATQVARLLVSDGGHYLHALDASGRIVYHFPTSLGSSYDPSPTGRYTIKSVTRDPWWHYQPSILADVPDTKSEARIPPGPNNAVGSVWMALSEPHYGIHGTNAPETIGYATSAGCVRLTNWDALLLADKVRPGTEVAFRDFDTPAAEDRGASAPVAR